MADSSMRHLLQLIESQLDWGPSGDWRTRDFEKLNHLILQKTNVSLSPSTLRRVWGKVDYNNQPSGTTLDTLAQFAGFIDWRTFNREAKSEDSLSQDNPLPKASALEKMTSARKFLIKWVTTALFLAGLTILIASLIRTGFRKDHPDSYEFNSHLITHDLPNSVVFHYNVRAAGDDPVYLQQDWDNSNRTLLSKEGHAVSSIYYRPGYFEAKLVVGTHIVKEEPLLIPTDGWLGLVAQQPVPVYLTSDEFTDPAQLHVSDKTLEKDKVLNGSQPPVIEFYNVGNFKPVPLASFIFSADTKNEYKEGAGKCQQLSVILITNGIPVSVPLSAPGCIAALTLTDGRHDIPGTAEDFSGFGTDLSDWVNICIKSDGQKIRYLVNGKVAYQSKLPSKVLNIVGIGFVFHGLGSVRNIDLRSNGQNVFQSFLAVK